LLCGGRTDADAGVCVSGLCGSDDQPIPGTAPEAIPSFHPWAADGHRSVLAFDRRNQSNSGHVLSASSEAKESIKGWAPPLRIWKLAQPPAFSPSHPGGRGAAEGPGMDRMERLPWGPSKAPGLAGATEQGSGKDGQHHRHQTRLLPAQPGAEQRQRAWLAPAQGRPADQPFGQALEALHKASRPGVAARTMLGQQARGGPSAAGLAHARSRAVTARPAPGPRRQRRSAARDCSQVDQGQGQQPVPGPSKPAGGATSSITGSRRCHRACGLANQLAIQSRALSSSTSVWIANGDRR